MTLADFTLRILGALVCGLVIGIERQWHHRLAGMRTHALVATGAAAFVTVSALAAGDGSARIAAQVVSGIGFLGAGVIFKEGFNVRGLTTAATLWCAAAVGTLSGSGFVTAAAVVTGMVIGTNICMRPFSHYLDRRQTPTEMETSYLVHVPCRRPAEAEVRALLLQAAGEDSLIVRGVRSVPASETESIRLETTVVVHGRGQEVVERLAHRLGAHPQVGSVSWEMSGEAHLD
jgi:putative Mg2+ transporter-C (MgtC) family protein